jgi:hypothetical protein
MYYNLEHIFTSVTLLPQNVIFSLFADLVTLTILVVTCESSAHYAVFSFQNPPFAEPEYNGHRVKLGGMFGTIWSTLSKQLNYT